MRGLTIRSVALAAVGVVAAGLVACSGTAAPFDRWPDSRFGAVVVDRATGGTTVDHHGHDQFRSASLVKLLIALDLLERPTPLAAPDRQLISAMLRSSDDDAASVLWAREGAPAIVERSVARLGLTDTEPPASRSSWGYTATSAQDVARVYRHLLDTAPAGVRDLVLGELRATTRCAVDGRDQYGGLPHAAAGRPWAAKQGWSGFGEVPDGARCVPTPAPVVDPAADDRVRAAAPPAPAQTGSEPDIDTEGPVLHTGGVVGDRDDRIVVVLSLHPEGTPFGEATRRLDDVTGALVSAPRR
ncbi:serine hydrolase [Actinomycetospora aeridis]|uniref:Serine hydrolase n=1 Tax=Actinomycetospora aeridis TaxID=3129231 RepID=A0ABU8MZJ4_9PSEU